MACLVIMFSMIRFWWELNSSIDILAAVIMMTKYLMTGLQKNDRHRAPRLLQENYLKYQQMALMIWEIRSILKTKSDYLLKSLWRLVVMSKRRNVKMTRRRKHRLSMLARRETYWQCFELEKKPRLFFTLVKSPQVFCNLHWSWTKLARSIPAHNWHLLGTVYSQKNHWSQPLIHFDI